MFIVRVVTRCWAIGAIAFMTQCSPTKKESSNQEIAHETPSKKGVAGTAFDPSMGWVDVLDPALEKLISKDAKIEVLSQGYTWTEGPVWVEEGGYLLFSEIPKNTVWKWSSKDSVSLYLNPSGFSGPDAREGESGSNGLFINKMGQLLLCQHGDRVLGVMDSDLSNPVAEYIALADNYNGKRFNSPNDLDIHSSGDIYFTDPPYGLEKLMEDPAKELDFQGVYKWSAQDSTVQLLYKDLSRPNGITLSLDEKTAYVANSDTARVVWMAFDVMNDGSFANERTLYDATQMAKEEFPELGMPDGLEIDATGNIYATGPGGVWIFSKEEKLLGRIITGQKTANCTIGGDGFLYMTAHSYLLRIPLKS